MARFLANFGFIMSSHSCAWKLLPVSRHSRKTVIKSNRSLFSIKRELDTASMYIETYTVKRNPNNILG